MRSMEPLAGARVDRLARDRPREVGREVHPRAGNLVGRYEVAQRGLRGPLVVHDLYVDISLLGEHAEIALQRVGEDRPGTDAVHPDPVLAELGREQLYQVRERRLRARVRTEG